MEFKKQRRDDDHKKYRQSSKFDLTPEQKILQKEVNLHKITPFSFSNYKKTSVEKQELNDARIAHRYLLKAYGYDPKRVMNVPVDRAGKFVRAEK